MPRDPSGTYTAPSNSFNPAVDSTIIDPTDWNATLADLSSAMTDSLSRTAQGGMSADLDMNNNDINEIKTAVFQGATSGNTTVQATAIAGTTTLTLPAATDTLVGKDTTDTLTNKTLTSPVLTTPALGVATATTINKVTITPPATNAVMTLVDGTTMTGPAASGTVMTLGNPETVTGVKAFTNLRLNGSTSGQTSVNATAIASGTITIPAATDTLMGKATTDVMTNKTFNSTGAGNVLQVSSVTVSAGQYPGEPTTNNATAGNVGEYGEANLAPGSAVSLTSGAEFNITSISLGAGDWDVCGVVDFVAAGTTVRNLYLASLGTVSGVISNVVLNRQIVEPGNAKGAANEWYLNIGPSRFSLSATTTVYLVARADFTTSTATAYGSIRARRMR